jgi:hypothetical protein
MSVRVEVLMRIAFVAVLLLGGAGGVDQER